MLRTADAVQTAPKTDTATLLKLAGDVLAEHLDSIKGDSISDLSIFRNHAARCVCVSVYHCAVVHSRPQLFTLCFENATVQLSMAHMKIAHTLMEGVLVQRHYCNMPTSTPLHHSFEQEFLEDLDALGCRPPDVLTRVSEYIPEIVEFIERVVANGMAYEARGSVYFDTQAFG